MNGCVFLEINVISEGACPGKHFPWAPCLFPEGPSMAHIGRAIVNDVNVLHEKEPGVSLDKGLNDLLFSP